MKLVAAIVALAVINGHATAEANTPTDLDYFDLWNNCGTTTLVVESLKDNAAKIGLTKERIETMVRSRLRAARIYDDSATGTYIYVNVNVGSTYFATSVEFNKRVLDIATDHSKGGTGFAATWIFGGAGTHGQDAGFILQSLSEHVDRFIDEYLWVNEEAC